VLATIALASAIQAGSLSLTPCADAPSYYCGTLARALDPSGEVPGTIAVAFRWLPHSDTSRPGDGVIVASEGGPGYPSGESRDGYRALFAPLLTHRDLLLMDNRGTGRSDAIDCEPLQSARVMTLANVTACGRTLGEKSDLYGSGLAADDLDAILAALGVKSVDIYGDSYGTFFVQTFAARHPGRVHAIVLDAAYPAVGGDPWYPSEAPAIRQTFDLACRRDPRCAAQRGSTETRVEHLLVALRTPRAPVSPTDLALVMDSAGLDPLAFRDLDAASRAYVRGDGVPLRRLVREAYDYEAYDSGGLSAHSEGLFAANTCSDGPTAYDMRLSPEDRVLQWERLVAAKRASDPNLYAPFTLDEFLAMPLDYSYVPLCQTWPVASPAHPSGQAIPAGTKMPDVPVLVLGGDLDTTTTPPETDAAAALFPHAQRVLVANTGHVTAVGDVYGCASVIVQTFFSGARPDVACASAIPPMRLVSSFARTVAAVEPARALPGNRAGAAQLRAAASAVLAAGDALARANGFDLTAGSGLRGGTFTATQVGERGETVRLHGVAWTSDQRVSGVVAFDATSGAARARLDFSGPGAGTIDAAWNAYGRNARASVAGTSGGRAIHATMEAP